MHTNLTSRTALVTGASSGIGLAVAIGLASRGHQVVLHARAGARADAALTRVRAAATGPAPMLITGDLSSQAEVRRIASEIRGRLRTLDILIHNAATVSPERSTTVDGHELQFAVNHLAVYLLTHELLPLMRAADRARIVVTASQVERSGSLDFADLMSGARYQMDQAYSRSKLANVLFTYELAGRLKGSGITANCLHPGVVRTPLLNNLLGLNAHPGPAARLRGAIGGLLKRTGLRSDTPDWALDTEKGSETTLFVATAAEIEGVTGQYFDVGKVAESSLQSRNAELRADLWRISATLTGVDPDWP